MVSPLSCLYIFVFKRIHICILYSGLQGSGDCGTDLITLNHSSLHPTERLVVAMRHPQQGFYHIIATDYSVLLVDERFPNHTVGTCTVEPYILQ